MYLILENQLLLIGICLAILVSIIFIILSYFLILRDQTFEKNSAYECGFQPFEHARIPFDIHFYMVALLFLIFDLEILFLIPWILSACLMQFFSYIILVFFLFVLLIGFIYEWKIGALNW